jgi:hypothetical protein
MTTMPSDRQFEAMADALVGEIDGWRSGICPEILEEVYRDEIDVDRYDPEQIAPQGKDYVPWETESSMYHFAVPQRGASTLLRLMAEGGPIITACGASWSPTRMPEQGDTLCPKCRDAFTSGRTNVLWLRTHQRNL